MLGRRLDEDDGTHEFHALNTLLLVVVLGLCLLSAYLIKKYRFYIKCCVCNNEIAFKTDPKNQDYVCESGVLSASFVFFVFAKG